MMTADRQNIDRRVKILRWLARGIGTLIASFWLFIVVVSIFTESTDMDTESAIMTILIFSSIIGVIVAWFRELEGGVILLVVAIAHSINALIVAGRNKGFALLVSGGPFFIIGSLFIATWWRSRELSSSANDN
jgi:glycerol uptake facilitator-like aquaporin